jgi:hypothetical protein
MRNTFLAATWACRSVVRTDVCPGNFCMCRTSVPASKKCVANEWRKPCIEMSLFTPAFARLWLNTFCAGTGGKMVCGRLAGIVPRVLPRHFQNNFGDFRFLFCLVMWQFRI